MKLRGRQIWRSIGLLLAALGLALALGDLASPGASMGFDALPAHTANVNDFRVVRLLPRRDLRPELAVGDVFHLRDTSLAGRMRFARQRPGETFVLERAGRPPVAMRYAPDARSPLGFVYLAIALAFTLVGGLLALRRPEAADARALATLLLGFGVALQLSPMPWMPPGLVLAVMLAGLPLQFVALGAAVHLATIFPDPAAGGYRGRLRRANPPLVLALIACSLGLLVWMLVLDRTPPKPLTLVSKFSWLYFVIAVASAFHIANLRAQGAERTRVRWVSLAIGIGFAGPIVTLAAYVIGGAIQPWMQYTALTLLAIPFGLGYAILRHRVVDIGFAVNRALVFGTLSAIVVIAFMVLEWALGSAFVRVSHITSTSLELGLALVLGFSLRWIHARVDRVVDDLFFRERHAAERALRTFAREVAFITDPRVAIARGHAELTLRTGAAACAVYVIDGPAALRVDAGETPLPDRVDVDDPALVRMRAGRTAVRLHGLGSGFAGEHAFPMLVRDTVAGAVVLAAKSNGEAYAPDELATVETTVLALGNALDALHTAALKREIARVLLDGAPLEALRRTVDSASWVRGGAPQPAARLTGLAE